MTGYLLSSQNLAPRRSELQTLSSKETGLQRRPLLLLQLRKKMASDLESAAHETPGPTPGQGKRKSRSRKDSIRSIGTAKARVDRGNSARVLGDGFKARAARP